MIRRLLAVLLLAASFPAVLRAETLFSGDIRFDSALYFHPTDFWSSQQEFDLRFAPGIQIFTDAFDFFFQGTAAYDSASGLFSFDLVEGQIDFRPFDFLQFRLGRFAYSPGIASFFPSTDFFSRSDSVAVVSNGFGSAPAADLIQCTLSFSTDIFIRATYQPFFSPPAFPEVASRWFPWNQIPTELTINAPPIFNNVTLLLDEVSYAETQNPEGILSNAGGSVECGFTADSLDVLFLYYNGWDNDTALYPQLEFPEGIYADAPFTITLLPVPLRLEAIGLDVDLIIDPFRLYVDFSHAIEKTFALMPSGSFQRMDPETLTTTQNAVTLGLEYSLPFPLTLFAEWHRTTIDSFNTRIISSLLPETIIGGFRCVVGGFEGVLLGLYAREDNCGLAAINASFVLPSDIRFSLYVPFFFGTPETVLGQYSDKRFFRFSLALSF